MKKHKRKPILRVSSLIIILIIELLILNVIFTFCIIDVYASELKQQASERALPEEHMEAGLADAEHIEAGLVDVEYPEVGLVDATGTEGHEAPDNEPEISEAEPKVNQDEPGAKHNEFKRHAVSTEFILYDIPLSDELQRYTFDISAQRGLNHEMILAIMFRESTFRAHAVSPTNDYGIMQINRGNHKWLSESLGITDFLDPKQSIDAGTFHLKGIVDNGFDDVHKILMVYNLGGRKANELWDQGITTSAYSRRVVEYMESLRWMRRNENAPQDAQDDNSDAQDDNSDDND